MSGRGKKKKEKEKKIESYEERINKNNIFLSDDQRILLKGEFENKAKEIRDLFNNLPKFNYVINPLPLLALPTIIIEDKVILDYPFTQETFNKIKGKKNKNNKKKII
jgi:hypothetical protein